MRVLVPHLELIKAIFTVILTTWLYLQVKCFTQQVSFDVNAALSLTLD